MKVKTSNKINKTKSWSSIKLDTPLAILSARFFLSTICQSDHRRALHHPHCPAYITGVGITQGYTRGQEYQGPSQNSG